MAGYRINFIFTFNTNTDHDEFYDETFTYIRTPQECGKVKKKKLQSQTIMLKRISRGTCFWRRVFAYLPTQGYVVTLIGVNKLFILHGAEGQLHSRSI